MKKSKHSDSEKVKAVKSLDGGVSADVICREHGKTTTTRTDRTIPLGTCPQKMKNCKVTKMTVVLLMTLLQKKRRRYWL